MRIAGRILRTWRGANHWSTTSPKVNVWRRMRKLKMRHSEFTRPRLSVFPEDSEQFDASEPLTSSSACTEPRSVAYLRDWHVDVVLRVDGNVGHLRCRRCPRVSDFPLFLVSFALSIVFLYSSCASHRDWYEPRKLIS
jgi:hypothetical protein